MSDATRSQQPAFLDEVRQVRRLHHDSMHTERSSVEWIVQFVRFHGMRSREDLLPADRRNWHMTHDKPLGASEG